MANTPPDNSEPNKGPADPTSAARGEPAAGNDAPKHHDDVIAGLRAVHGSDFEVLDTGPSMPQ